MKTLLLKAPIAYPDTPCVPPLGIAYIAAVLEQHNIEMQLIDLDLERERMNELSRILKDLKPDIIGISGVTPAMDNVYHIAKVAKSVLRDVLVVVGGPHPAALPERTLREAKGSVDVVVRGEGEYTFLEIVKGERWEKIKGVGYLEEGKYIESARREPIKDLDPLPFPARHLLKMELYRGWGPAKASPHTHLIASRGCPFECIFCSEVAVFGRNHRTRDPNRVVDEIELLMSKYGIREVEFYDDLFTLKKKWVMKVCDALISRGIILPWKALSRPDSVDMEMLERMKAAGCWLLCYGYESGSERILRNIKKRLTPEESLRAAELTRRAGMKNLGFFMLGNVGETQETIRETISFVRKIKPDYYQFAIVRPDPGSVQYETYKEEIEKRYSSWSDYYAFPLDPANDPNSRAYHIRPVGTDLTVKELLAYRYIAEMAVNKRAIFRYAWRAIKGFNLRRVRQAYNVAKEYIELYGWALGFPTKGRSVS